MPLAKAVNIALSSDYWIFGVVVTIILTIASQSLWESLPMEIKEMFIMTMLSITSLLVAFADSEGLV